MFVPLRGTKKERVTLPTAALLRSLQRVSDRCVPSGHGAEWAYLIICEYLVIINCC